MKDANFSFLFFLLSRPLGRRFDKGGPLFLLFFVLLLLPRG